MKKLLIFDAFGTLISTGDGSLQAVKQILSLQEQNIDPVRFHADWKKYHRRHIDWCNENSFLPECTIFEKDLQALYEDYGIDRPYERDVEIMLHSIKQRKLFSDTKVSIDKLRGIFRVVIGSTTDTEPLIVNLQQCGLEVDEVYTSEMLGWYKPSEHFYKAILSLEGCLVHEAIFIGDSLIDDVYGPKQLGLETILIDRTGKSSHFPDGMVPDHVVFSLNQVFDLLK